MTSSACALIDERSYAAVSGAELRSLLESFLIEGKSCRMRANGSSMTPFIRHGDVVTIAPVDRAIRLGDIVAAADKDGGRVVVHRVVKSRTGGDRELLLRGDSVSEEGDWVPGGSVLGMVVGISRNGRDVAVRAGFIGRILVWMSRCFHGSA